MPIFDFMHICIDLCQLHAYIEKRGFLKVDLKSKSMFSGTLHFDMISDKSAVLGGIGRGNGDVLRILENGNLYYSGFEFVKIK